MLLSELEFGSYLSYSPWGDSDLAERSRRYRDAVKGESNIGDPPKVMSQFIAEKIKNNLNILPFKDFFSSNVLLIPIPKSSLMKPDTLWVPKEIAMALSKQGLGIYYPCLKRISAVQKASYSKPENRPKPIDHFNSIEYQPQLTPVSECQKFVLIDDIITRGSTLLGCASKLKQKFPNVSIKAFSVVRTISNPLEFEKISAPCVGKITCDGYNTLRRP